MARSPPARKPFDVPVWEPATRTFTATVEWGENTFGGDARWEYTMVFSDDFAFIAGGACRKFDADGQSTGVSAFPIQLQYIRADTSEAREEWRHFLHLRGSGADTGVRRRVDRRVGRWRR